MTNWVTFKNYEGFHWRYATHKSQFPVFVKKDNLVNIWEQKKNVKNFQIRYSCIWTFNTASLCLCNIARQKLKVSKDGYGFFDCGVVFQKNGFLGRDRVHLMKGGKNDFAYRHLTLVRRPVNYVHWGVETKAQW